MTGVLLRRENVDMETYRDTGEGPIKAKEKTEIMVTQRNAKDCWQPPEARRGQEIFSR